MSLGGSLSNHQYGWIKIRETKKTRYTSCTGVLNLIYPSYRKFVFRPHKKKQWCVRHWICVSPVPVSNTALTSQHLPIVMVVTFESLAAPFLHQWRTVLATVLRFLFNYPGPWHHTGSAGGVTFAPRSPLTGDAIDHWKKVRECKI